MMLPRPASVCLLLTSALMAQDTAPIVAHTVRASGEATVTANPDQAEFTIGVSSPGTTAQAAAAQNATQTTQLLDTVKRALGANGEVKTSGYSVVPDYQYSKNGAPTKIIGYRANNSVLVTINNLTVIGTVIDAATQAGANNINGISFTLRDDAEVRSRALAEAAAKARSNAEAIAKALKLSVSGILEAHTLQTGGIRPLVFTETAATAQNVQIATPIQPGNLEIHATVVVTLAVRE